MKNTKKKKQLEFLDWFIIFVWLQPILDLFTSLSTRYNLSFFSIGAVVRYLVLVVMGIFLLFKMKIYKHKKFFAFIVLIVTYLLVYIISSVYTKGVYIGFLEIKYAIKSFYFILVFLFIFLYKQKGYKSHFEYKDIIYSSLLYIFFLFIPSLTGTAFNSYSHFKSGTIGWFYAANEIGSILSFLAPLFVYYALNKKSLLLKIILLFSYLLTCMHIGTKVPFLGIFFSLIIFAMYYVINAIKERKTEMIRNKVMPLLALLIFVVVWYPYSSVGKNISKHVRNQTSTVVVEKNDSGKTNLEEIERMDFENIVFSGRTNSYKNKAKEYKKSFYLDKLFGKGYYELDDKIYIAKSIEMDIFDTIFNFGILGCILIFIFPLSVSIFVVLKYLTNFKKNIWNIKLNAILFSLFLAFSISFLAGHVITAPSVSIYIAILLMLAYQEVLKPTKVSKKIWIDITNSPHAILFNPVIKELKKKKYEVVVTTRDYAQTIDLLKLFEIEYTVVGDHKGKNKYKKTWGLIERSWQLYWFIRKEKVSASLSMSSFTAIIASNALDIPHMTLYDYEYTTGHYISYRLSNIILTPKGVDEKLLKKYGSNKQNTVFYPGLKEQIYIEYYLPNKNNKIIIQEKLKKNLGITTNNPIILFRPEATMAHYQNNVNSMSLKLIKYLSEHKSNPVIIVIPRTPDQKKEYINLKYKNVIVPSKTLNGIDLIQLSDLVIGAGGTVNREAAALGVPAYSIYKGGKMGAIDNMLIKTKKMVYIDSERDFNKIKVKKVKKDVSKPLKNTMNFYLKNISLLLKKGGVK